MQLKAHELAALIRMESKMLVPDASKIEVLAIELKQAQEREGHIRTSSDATKPLTLTRG